MNNKDLVMDVANIVLTDLETEKIFATATASMSSLSATLDEESLRAGWGGGVVAVINSNRNVELSFTEMFFSEDLLSITQGTDIEEDVTNTILTSFEGEVVGTAPSLEVVMPAGATVTEAIFVDKDGSQNPVTVTTGKAAIPELSEAVAGDIVTIFYKTDVVGKQITIDSQKFPKLFSLQYHTRAFNPTTSTVSKDIYIQFDKVKPSGNFDINLEVSSNVSTDMTFTAMNKSANSTEMGRYFSVDRLPTP